MRSKRLVMKEKPMAKTSMQTILQATTKGAVRSFRAYYEMSRGWWMGNSPEYWYSCGIAQSLDKEGLTVTLETSMSEIANNAANVAKGKPGKGLRGGGRCDVLVWWETLQTPRCIIEVKCRWALDEECRKDIDRIVDALSKYGNTEDKGKLQSGIFLFATDAADKGSKAKTENLLRNKYEEMRENIQWYLDGKKFRSSPPYLAEADIRFGPYVEDEGMMAAYGFLIRI